MFAESFSLENKRQIHFLMVEISRNANDTAHISNEHPRLWRLPQ